MSIVVRTFGQIRVVVSPPLVLVVAPEGSYEIPCEMPTDPTPLQETNLDWRSRDLRMAQEYAERRSDGEGHLNMFSDHADLGPVLVLVYAERELCPDGYPHTESLIR